MEAGRILETRQRDVSEEEYGKKKQTLLTSIEEYAKEDVAIAFSGGADSSLLLKVVCEAAEKYRRKVYAITVQTELHTVEDLKVAEKVAKEIGAFHTVLHIDELNEAGIEMNPLNRCYLCKKLLFTRMKEKAEQMGITRILEGTNADDLRAYRPGLKAVKELGIISPLADALLTKEEVRALASEYGISVAVRPANPCMATRFPYGTRLTKEDMGRAGQGEAYIKSLGVYNVRLRVQEQTARIEVDPDYFEHILQNRKEIVQYLKQIGYRYVSLDMEGFRSGSMDEVHLNR